MIFISQNRANARAFGLSLLDGDKAVSARGHYGHLLGGLRVAELGEVVLERKRWGEEDGRRG